MTKRPLAVKFRSAYLIFGCIMLFCFSAELWSNGAPLILHYRGTTLFPAIKEVRASELGIQDRLRIDYKSLSLKDGDWAVWSPNRWSPDDVNRAADAYPLPPSRTNLLGTDDRGRDVLARLLYGARITLIFAGAVGAIAGFIAILIGAASGYLGGWVDLLTQRVIEVLSTVPQLFVLIFLVTIFEPSLKVLVVVSAFFGWIGTSFYIRGEALRVRQLEYVEAARGFGASGGHILLKHVIPNSLGPAISLSPFILIANVTGLTALDFMGLGLPPPAPSWGELLAQGQTYFNTAWWLAVFPTLALFILLLTIAMIGEHLRVRYEDPRA